jgi:hypothetical protein
MQRFFSGFSVLVVTELLVEQGVGGEIICAVSVDYVLDQEQSMGSLMANI